MLILEAKWNMILKYISFLIVISFECVRSGEAKSCTTPNNERSTCILLLSCPGLMKNLGTLNSTLVQHFQKSICPIGGAGELYVCCGKADRDVPETVSSLPIIPTAPVTHKPGSSKPSKKPTGTTKPIETDKSAHREMVKRTLIPDRHYCGLQHTDDRFYNDTETALDEFPWLVHIKITDLEYEEEYGDRCSGVLISRRYVLTDAYCAYHAVKVIVGEHKTNTNESCVVDGLMPECTEPAYEVRVESVIRDGRPENGPFDFALLRLNKTLNLSDFVRPICLPFVESERPKKNHTLVFSGWGALGPSVTTKKRIIYEQTNSQRCYDAKFNGGIEGNVKFANVTFLCAKPKKNNTDMGCGNDHGGALMYSRKVQWFAEAVVINVLTNNFGCSKNALVASIKITHKTLDWILDSIKP